MQREFVTVDVFTDRRFGGNPLAVFPDGEGLSSAQMQSIAAEFNLSETTFVLPAKSPSHTAEVRIFTPKAELPFAALHQLLRPALEHVDALPARQAAALRGALGLGDGAGEERFLIFAACLSLLSELYRSIGGDDQAAVVSL